MMYIPKSLTQRQKVIYVLREVGEEGIHSFHIIRKISHKAPARICELRKEGWDITSTPEKMGNSIGVRYRLKE